MDPGRQADLDLIASKKKDYSLTKHQRQALSKARHAIYEEQSNPEIRNIRNQYIQATSVGDVPSIERLGRQLDILSKGGKL